MADRIKGITIEIGGDTTGLSKALSGVNSEIRNTQSQLKDVERLLKLDPSNTELLRQKQKLLADAVKETKDKLETLKTAEKQVQEQFAQGKISEEQYNALKREIIATEERLKSLEKQAANSNVALQQIGIAGEKVQEFGSKVTAAGEALIPVTAAITGVGAAAVKTTADFDEAMSKVAAISGATGEEFDALREKAREMGAKTKFSASEAAEAMNYMAMAGWKTEDMLEGIEGIMNLAAASGEDLATTSDIVTDALTAFGLSAKDSGHFADILAAASSNANTNVSMMGESFKYVAPLAGSLGYSAEDVSVALGMMANSGIKASQAGTSLRSIITRLVKPTKDSSKAMKALDISITNTDGTMKPFMEVMEDLRDRFNNLTEDEKALYAAQLGGQEAMSGLLAIVNAGETDFSKLSDAVTNCEGVTQKMADTMQDNLNGQLTILMSQLQEAAISIGDVLVPKIRELIAKVQEWTDWFNSLNEAQKEMVVKIGLIVAAMGPLLIVIGDIGQGMGYVMELVSKMGPLLLTLGGPAGALTITAAAAAGLGAAFILAKDKTADYYEEAAKLTDMEQANKDKIDELMESYSGLSETRKEAISMIDSQTDHEKELWEELQSLVDENGKVKEGYEDRAAFITSTLSEALGQEINITDGVIQNYKDLQSEIDSLIEKKRAEATLNAYQAEYSEAVSNTKQAQNELATATTNAKDATDNYNAAVEKQKNLQAEYNDLMRQYETDGTNDAIRQQLYDLQNQMIANGETIDGLKVHMDENNQTMETARQVLESYNTTVANYEGAAAAIISGDQTKISESLMLLTNDFQTAETSTRESLEAQCEAYRTKLAEAREAVKQGASGITDEYVAELVRLELKSRQELAKVPEAAGQAVTDAAGAVKGKTAEMEGAGTDFAAGLATGIIGGATQVTEAAKQIAEAGLDETRKALDSHSPSEKTYDIGLDYDAGFAEGIADGAGQVIESVNVVMDAALSALDAQLQTSSAATQTYQSSMALSWSTWASTLLTTITNTLSNLNLNTSAQLISLQNLFQMETTTVQTDWDTKWTTIENKHKATMEKIKHLTAQTLQTVRMLNRTEVTAIKTDSITITNEMVTGIDEELKRLEPTVRNGYEPAINYIKGLIPQARGWSHDMMDEFIAGIRDKMDELEDACRDVADTVSDYMHFTRPEKGPLRYYEEWMPHMMQGLAKGIEENRSLITEQMKGLAADMSVIQNAGSAKPVINFSNRSVLVLDGKEIAETVDTYLGEVYG